MLGSLPFLAPDSHKGYLAVSGTPLIDDVVAEHGDIEANSMDKKQLREEQLHKADEPAPQAPEKTPDEAYKAIRSQAMNVFKHLPKFNVTEVDLYGATMTDLYITIGWNCAGVLVWMIITTLFVILFPTWPVWCCDFLSCFICLVVCYIVGKLFYPSDDFTKLTRYSSNFSAELLLTFWSMRKSKQSTPTSREWNLQLVSPPGERGGDNPRPKLLMFNGGAFDEKSFLFKRPLRKLSVTTDENQKPTDLLQWFNEESNLSKTPDEMFKAALKEGKIKQRCSFSMEVWSGNLYDRAISNRFVNAWCCCASVAFLGLPIAMYLHQMFIMHMSYCTSSLQEHPDKYGFLLDAPLKCNGPQEAKCPELCAPGIGFVHFADKVNQKLHISNVELALSVLFQLVMIVWWSLFREGVLLHIKMREFNTAINNPQLRNQLDILDQCFTDYLNVVPSVRRFCDLVSTFFKGKKPKSEDAMSTANFGSSQANPCFYEVLSKVQSMLDSGDAVSDSVDLEVSEIKKDQPAMGYGRASPTSADGAGDDDSGPKFKFQKEILRPKWFQIQDSWNLLPFDAKSLKDDCKVLQYVPITTLEMLQVFTDPVDGFFFTSKEGRPSMLPQLKNIFNTKAEDRGDPARGCLTEKTLKAGPLVVIKGCILSHIHLWYEEGSVWIRVGEPAESASQKQLGNFLEKMPWATPQKERLREHIATMKEFESMFKGADPGEEYASILDGFRKYFTGTLILPTGYRFQEFQEYGLNAGISFLFQMSYQGAGNQPPCDVYYKNMKDLDTVPDVLQDVGNDPEEPKVTYANFRMRSLELFMPKEWSTMDIALGTSVVDAMKANKGSTEIDIKVSWSFQWDDAEPSLQKDRDLITIEGNTYSIKEVQKPRAQTIRLGISPALKTSIANTAPVSFSRSLPKTDDTVMDCSDWVGALRTIRDSLTATGDHRFGSTTVFAIIRDPGQAFSKILELRQVLLPRAVLFVLACLFSALIPFWRKWFESADAFPVPFNYSLFFNAISILLPLGLFLSYFEVETKRLQLLIEALNKFAKRTSDAAAGTENEIYVEPFRLHDASMCKIDTENAENMRNWSYRYSQLAKNVHDWTDTEMYLRVYLAPARMNAQAVLVVAAAVLLLCFILSFQQAMNGKGMLQVDKSKMKGLMDQDTQAALNYTQRQASRAYDHVASQVQDVTSRIQDKVNNVTSGIQGSVDSALHGHRRLGQDSACYDDPDFVDEYGSVCAEWRGFNCASAMEAQRYGAATMRKVLKRCPRACSLCMDVEKDAAYSKEHVRSLQEVLSPFEEAVDEPVKRQLLTLVEHGKQQFSKIMVMSARRLKEDESSTSEGGGSSDAGSTDASSSDATGSESDGGSTDSSPGIGDETANANVKAGIGRAQEYLSAIKGIDLTKITKTQLMSTCIILLFTYYSMRLLWFVANINDLFDKHDTYLVQVKTRGLTRQQQREDAARQAKEAAQAASPDASAGGGSAGDGTADAGSADAGAADAGAAGAGAADAGAAGDGGAAAGSADDPNATSTVKPMDAALNGARKDMVDAKNRYEKALDTGIEKSRKAQTNYPFTLFGIIVTQAALVAYLGLAARPLFSQVKSAAPQLITSICDYIEDSPPFVYVQDEVTMIVNKTNEKIIGEYNKKLKELHDKATDVVDKSNEFVHHQVDTAHSHVTHAVDSAEDSADHAVSSLEKSAHGAVSSAEKSAHGAVSSAEKSVHGAVSSAEKSVHHAVSSAEKSAHGAVSSAEKSVHHAVSSAEKSAHGAVSSAEKSGHDAVSSHAPSELSDETKGVAHSHIHKAGDAVHGHIDKAADAAHGHIHKAADAAHGHIHKAADAAHGHIDKVGDAVHSHVKKVGDAAHGQIDKVGDAAHSHIDKAGKAAHGHIHKTADMARHKADQLAGMATNKSDELAAQAQDYMDSVAANLTLQKIPRFDLKEMFEESVCRPLIKAVSDELKKLAKKMDKAQEAIAGNKTDTDQTDSGSGDSSDDTAGGSDSSSSGGSGEDSAGSDTGGSRRLQASLRLQSSHSLYHAVMHWWDTHPGDPQIKADFVKLAMKHLELKARERLKVAPRNVHNAYVTGGFEAGLDAGLVALNKADDIGRVDADEQELGNPGPRGEKVSGLYYRWEM